MSITILKDKCMSCGACVIACPAKAITMIDGKASVDDFLCIDCLKCMGRCFMGAIFASHQS